MIKLIKETNYKPSVWELGFMEGIEKRLTTPLSYKQHVAMIKLYEKSTGGSSFQPRQVI